MFCVLVVCALVFGLLSPFLVDYSRWLANTFPPLWYPFHVMKIYLLSGSTRAIQKLETSSFRPSEFYAI